MPENEPMKVLDLFSGILSEVSRLDLKGPGSRQQLFVKSTPIARKCLTSIGLM